MGKTLCILSLSLSLIYCGQVDEGTGGGSITIVHNNQDIRLYKPVANGSLVYQNVVIDISVEDETYLTRYKVERKADAMQDYVYIGQTLTETYEDANLAGGTYDYKITAVYTIDGQEYESEAANVDDMQVLTIGPCLINGAMNVDPCG
ncbi:MAG: hypothetical protein KDK51_01540 [Deltaproteobacteria bacterium]|nr:hypothetical protein [Deltaproteobacteria bacterium]